MKKVFLPGIFICVTLFNLYAQEPLKYCGTDEMSYELYRDNPSLQATMQANRDALKTFTRQFINAAAERGVDTVYTIPVVFHVIHTYGSEDISDAQIMSGLKVLNWNFRKQNPDTATIVDAFKPIAADCQIEFHLAHIDPNGKCTSGINRIASLLTNTGGHNVKSIIHWDPSKYLNIYIVKAIVGYDLAAYCLMPDQADVAPDWDGIVAINTYIGDTGTSNPLQSVVLSHESGHYLNLFHIWGGNNVPGYYYLPVGQDTNCFIGDGVDDTPNTKGWGSCNLSASSCGNVVDNVQNAMDYSYCNFMFTQGQKLRMRAALNDTMAHRNNLISQQNLDATGVNLATLCHAAFLSSRQVICAGDTIFFTDKSLATPDSWLWNFGDGGTSTEQNPAYVFYGAGDYYVVLTATKGNDIVTSDSLLIHVNNPIANNPFYVQNFENIHTFSESQLFSTTDNTNLDYNISALGQGYNSAQSIVMRMADTTVTYSGRIDLFSPAIDLGHTALPAFSFKYAFSQKTINNYDQMEFFISKDCGKTWYSVVRKTSSGLRTVSTTQTDVNWAPLDSTQWKTYSFSVPLAYCVTGFMFKIEFTNYQGNSFYIDNINVNPSANTGIAKIPIEGVELMPNPASQYILISGLPEPMPCAIIDVNGKVCALRKNLDNAETIDISQLAAGVYILRLENDIAFCSKRFVKY